MGQFDPKEIIARANAEDALAKKIKEHEQSITKLVKHRGAFTAMLKDGTMVSGSILIGTPTKLAYRVDGEIQNQMLLVEDVAEFELNRT